MAQSKSSFSVQNPDALANAIANLESSLSESTLRKAAAAGATVFKDEVMLRVPKASGDLAAGLTVAFVPEQSVEAQLATYIVTWVGDTGKEWKSKNKVSRRSLAGFIENGTSKKAASPFVTPAFGAAETKAVEKGNEVITAALKAKV
jgi:HK97 gp10 family phage protein